jgi:hypothetical protein
MVIRVTTSAPVATIELRAGGRSYLELPRPFAMHSVPELVHEDTYAPEPNSYQTATRTFNFNDRSWAARSFTGETGPARQFSFNLDQKAEILFAWIEVYDSAFVQDVRRGRAPDPQKILQGASVSLLRDGTEIDHSGSGFGTLGQGTEALAVLDLTPGPLTLSVDSQNESEDDSIPFTVHVVEVRGERTLRSMRWLFMEMDGVRTPVVAVCPRSIEPVPTTDKVRSVALDLDWNSEAAGLRGWTFSYSLPGVGSFPCSEAGTGDEMRLTIPPAERVWYLGATPAYNATEVSAFDTTFEMSARYTYSPVPLA